MAADTPPPTTPLSEGPLRGREALSAALAALIQQTQRELRLYAPRLDRTVFNVSIVSSALTAFATHHPRNRVCLLVDNAADTLRDNDRLSAAIQRLAGNIDVREFDENDRGAGDLFLVSDRAGHILQDDITRTEAIVVLNTPRETVALIERFNNQWERGVRVALRPLGL
ncbi:MAG: hypothetical protein HY308_02075 [Gammaproteobacteria bacterium]|nr:hypothetical protein [Gammaproteobacteria bacterium]